MIPTDNLLTFAATAFILIVIPGPSVLFVVSRGVTLGRRAALATVLGNDGRSRPGHRRRDRHRVARAALRSRVPDDPLRRRLLSGLPRGARVPRAEAAPERARRCGRDEVVPHHLPRRFRGRRDQSGAAVFFAAVLPQFADPALGHVPVQILALGLIFAAIALISDSAWGIAAGTLRPWLGRSPGRLERLGGAGGLAIVGLGVHLAVTGRRE